MAYPGGAGGGDTCYFYCKPPCNHIQRKRKSATSSSGAGDAAPSIPKPTQPAASDNKLHFPSARRSAPSAPVAAASNPDLTLFRFTSSTEFQVNHDNRATATLETATDCSNDARAIRERVLKHAEDALKVKSMPGGAASASSKVYKDIHGYTDFPAGFRREQTGAGVQACGAHGPFRASEHIRTSTRTDYRPDICTDFKEAGFCGFGDACAFLHDWGNISRGGRWIWGGRRKRGRGCGIWR